MGALHNIFIGAAENVFIRMVILVIVGDTVFGVLRAVKEKKFNSNFGIDGAIRKCGMIASVLFFVFVDAVINLNLIAFIPESIREYLKLSKCGMTEFFSILFIAYEAVSIIKNMTLCGLPVKKVWIYLKNLLGKYTDELPDDNELNELAKEDENEDINKRN